MSFLCHLTKLYMYLKFVIMRKSWCLATGTSHKIKFEFRVEKMAFKHEAGLVLCVHACVSLKKPDVPVSLKHNKHRPETLAETWFTVLKRAPGCRERRTRGSFWQHAILTGEFRQYYLLVKFCSSKFSTFMKCLSSYLADSVNMITHSEALFCVVWSTGK